MVSITLKNLNDVPALGTNILVLMGMSGYVIRRWRITGIGGSIICQEKSPYPRGARSASHIHLFY